MIRRAFWLAVALTAAAILHPAPAAATVPPALFVFAHPDDETIGSGVALVEHVRAGQQVHVMWLTQGEASTAGGYLNGTTVSGWWGVAHDPAAEGYVPLDQAALVAARATEALTAVRALASGLPGTLTVHQALLPDGAVSSAAAQAAIVAVADEIAPGGPVRLKTHSHLVDAHPDHLAAGAAARALKLADPVRFSDVRHYVQPPYWASPLLSQVAESWDLPADGGVTARVVNACRSYGAWAPEAGRYAIGYHSVYASHFAPLLANPRSMVHP